VPKPQQKPGKAGKGSKILCATLDFIMQANVDIAVEEAEKGNTQAANDAADIAIEAGKDWVKWGCGNAARVRKRTEMLSNKLKRSRRSARSRR
jgi:hypothetical protein